MKQLLYSVMLILLILLQAQPTSEFFTDFETGTSGKVINKGEENQRRCDFSIKLLTLVEAGDLSGYYAEVTRELDLEKRYNYNSITV